MGLAPSESVPSREKTIVCIFPASTNKNSKCFWLKDNAWCWWISRHRAYIFCHSPIKPFYDFVHSFLHCIPTANSVWRFANLHIYNVRIRAYSQNPCLFSDSLIVRILESQTPRNSESQTLRFSDSQTLRPSDSQTLRFSDSQILRLSDSHSLRLSGFHTLRLADSQTFRLSDSQTLRPSDSQTLRFSDSQSLRLSDSHSLRLSDPHTLRFSDSQTPRRSDSQTLKLSEAHKNNLWFSSLMLHFIPMSNPARRLVKPCFYNFQPGQRIRKASQLRIICIGIHFLYFWTCTAFFCFTIFQFRIHLFDVPCFLIYCPCGNELTRAWFHLRWSQI